MSETVYSSLANLGIDVRVNTAMKEVNAGGVVLADGGAIASDLTIWARGIKATAFLKGLSELETIAMFGASRTLVEVFSEFLQRKARPRLKLH